MSVLISYVLLGLSLSAPIGPINAAQLDKGIKSGFLHAWLLGVGALLADVLYMMLVYLGVAHFLNTSFMKTFLWLFGCFVLTYTGIESVLNAGKLTTSKKKADESVFKSFISGFFMSVSNPLTILFWLGIYGSILAKTAASYSTNELMLYSCAMIIGILLWDLTMAAIASSFRRFLTTALLSFISIVSGLSLIGFGVYFGVQAYILLFQ